MPAWSSRSTQSSAGRLGRRNKRAASMKASGLPAAMQEPDRPWFSTAVVLGIMIFCLWLLIFLPLMFLLFGPIETCGTMTGPIIVDDAGRVIEQGESTTSCTGGTSPFQTLGILAVIEAIPTLGVVLSIGSLRGLGKRWNSRLFGPTMWTIATGAFLGVFLLIAPPPAIWFSHESRCDVSGCVSSRNFEPIVALVHSVVIAFLALPFLMSVRRLISNWHSLRHA